MAEAPLLELGVAPGGLGRPISLFSPILREPSLMLDVVDLNGSGAATLESFYVDIKHNGEQEQVMRIIPFRTWYRP